ncbi:hypothetical protein AYO22_08295 [Fonsecaea multimorphosa]|nr:hypothetical protein AYO22_08295 [Fonsecaea multimorphosa]
MAQLFMMLLEPFSVSGLMTAAEDWRVRGVTVGLREHSPVTPLSSFAIYQAKPKKTSTTIELTITKATIDNNKARETMTKFNWNSLIHHHHSETPAGTENPVPATEETHHRRDSKLSHIMDSIRHTLAHEHEKLPANSQAQQPASAPVNTEAGNNGSLSPSLQAVASSKLNENNMGEHSHEADGTWGWPGLGTYTSEHPSHTGSTDAGAPPTSRHQSVSKGKEAEPERRASTVSQASKKSSDTQTGWPGLGPFNEDVEE